MRTLLSLVALVLAGTCAAQNTQYLNQGLEFGKSIAPTQKGQVVNPSAVQSNAWGNNTAQPTSIPQGMGAFSNPLTGDTTLNQANSIGLSSMGSNAITSCLTHVMGTNPQRDQECAAIKFLNSRCISPSTGQASILNKTGQSQNPNLASAQCEGTFGQGASRFDYQNLVKNTDTVFDVAKNAAANASQQAGQTCGQQTVVTKPAEYAVNTCQKNESTKEESCSQYLNVSVVTTTYDATISHSCAQGNLRGNYCERTNTQTGTAIYQCPPDCTLRGNECVKNEAIPASIASYTCPAGTTNEGDKCITTTTDTLAGTPNYTCPVGSVLDGTNCRNTVTNVITSAATIASYSCPSGYTVSGSSCTKTTRTTQNATPNYACEPGYTLSGETCSQTTTTVQAANTTKSCPSGYTLNSWFSWASWKMVDSCTQSTTDTVAAVTKCPAPTYTPYYQCYSEGEYGGCLAGEYGMELNIWVLTATPGMCQWRAGYYVGGEHKVGQGINNANTPKGWISRGSFRDPHDGYRIVSFIEVGNLNDLCPSGYTVNADRTTCTKTTVLSESVITNYTCPSGYTQVGSACVLETTTTQAASISNYTCPAGTTNEGDKCITTTTDTLDGKPNYSCPAGSVLDGSKCRNTVTNVITSDATIASYSCPSGYTNSGSSCTKTTRTTQNAKPNYACEPGFTLNDTTCSRQVITNASIADYSCPAGYVKNGSQCTLLISTPANTNYSCPDGSAAIAGICTLKTVKAETLDACTALQAKVKKAGA
jgi:conjugal transfer mating pair stabilization protein TraN